MKFERYRKVRDELKIDVIPVLNLFAILAPLLLLGSAVFHIGAIPTFLPLATPRETGGEIEPRQVHVSLFVSPHNIRIMTTHPGGEKNRQPDITLVVNKTSTGFDLKAMQQTLYQVKLLYENSDTLVVLPTHNVPYEQLIEIIDAAREITFHPGTTDEVTIPLFPVVVFSRKV